MNAAQKTLRSVRVLHTVFPLAAILYIALPMAVVRNSDRQVSQVIVLALGVAALGNIGIAFFYRSRMIRPAADHLRENPDAGDAARRWRGGVVVSLVFCESVVLFGLALRFIGASWNVCGIFYAVGILLMLAWTPKLDLLSQ